MRTLVVEFSDIVAVLSVGISIPVETAVGLDLLIF